MRLGTILHDKEFQFSNGLPGNKLVIILSTFGKNFLAVKTTSQQHRKNKISGCQIKDKPPNFYIPKNDSWFDEDTWVELDEVYELDFDILTSKMESKIAASKTVLSNELIKGVLNCAIESEDIEEFYLDFLKKTVKKL
ncbi:MAG: hypothetical protein ACR2G4_15645 [Pyrinomonadaceae bacterium]